MWLRRRFDECHNSFSIRSNCNQQALWIVFTQSERTDSVQLYMASSQPQGNDKKLPDQSGTGTSTTNIQIKSNKIKHNGVYMYTTYIYIYMLQYVFVFINKKCHVRLPHSPKNHGLLTACTCPFPVEFWAAKTAKYSVTWGGRNYCNTSHVILAKWYTCFLYWFLLTAFIYQIDLFIFHNCMDV